MRDTLKAAAVRPRNRERAMIMMAIEPQRRVIPKHRVFTGRRLVMIGLAAFLASQVWVNRHGILPRQGFLDRVVTDAVARTLTPH